MTTTQGTRLGKQLHLTNCDSLVKTANLPKVRGLEVDPLWEAYEGQL